jgi:hypothetical protein
MVAGLAAAKTSTGCAGHDLLGQRRAGPEAEQHGHVGVLRSNCSPIR